MALRSLFRRGLPKCSFSHRISKFFWFIAFFNAAYGFMKPVRNPTVSCQLASNSSRCAMNSTRTHSGSAKADADAKADAVVPKSLARVRWLCSSAFAHIVVILPKPYENPVADLGKSEDISSMLRYLFLVPFCSAHQYTGTNIVGISNIYR